MEFSDETVENIDGSDMLAIKLHVDHPGSQEIIDDVRPVVDKLAEYWQLKSHSIFDLWSPHVELIYERLKLIKQRYVCCFYFVSDRGQIEIVVNFEKGFTVPYPNRFNDPNLRFFNESISRINFYGQRSNVYQLPDDFIDLMQEIYNPLSDLVVFLGRAFKFPSRMLLGHHPFKTIVLRVEATDPQVVKYESYKRMFKDTPETVKLEVNELAKWSAFIDIINKECTERE